MKMNMMCTFNATRKCWHSFWFIFSVNWPIRIDWLDAVWVVWYFYLIFAVWYLVILVFLKINHALPKIHQLLSQTPLTCVIDKQIKNRKKCHLMCFGGPELCCLAILCCWSQKLEAEGTFYDLLSLAQGIIKMDFLLQLSKAIQAILIRNDTQSSKRKKIISFEETERKSN